MTQHCGSRRDEVYDQEDAKNLKKGLIILTFKKASGDL